eukprot:395042_1
MATPTHSFTTLLMIYISLLVLLDIPKQHHHKEDKVQLPDTDTQHITKLNYTWERRNKSMELYIWYELKWHVKVLKDFRCCIYQFDPANYRHWCKVLMYIITINCW